jgi:hypothetical protein
MPPPSEAIMPLVRKLGEKLGGEPYARSIEPFPILAPPQRLGRADVWPPEVLAEIQRFYAECAKEDEQHINGSGVPSLTSGPDFPNEEQNHGRS